ncbi:MAG: 4-aminobutyrate aminotransferase, partial [Pseudonocardiales bacterium]|nr:4-aminobutyrate aminotransferase [Pseudonocardiales bacterium]
GKMFAAEHFGVAPDVVLLAKGIASGMPLGAMMARRELMTWPAGSHGSTCAGNPVCGAAALATLELLDGGGLCDNAGRQGDRLMARLRAGLQPGPAAPSGVTDVRGLGLMIGIELVDAAGRPNPKAATDVLEYTRADGVLIGKGGLHGNVLRIAPPLTLTADEATEGGAIVVAALKRAGQPS